MDQEVMDHTAGNKLNIILRKKKRDALLINIKFRNKSYLNKVCEESQVDKI